MNEGGQVSGRDHDQRLHYYARAQQVRRAIAGFDADPALAYGAMPATLEVQGIDCARVAFVADTRGSKPGLVGAAPITAAHHVEHQTETVVGGHQPGGERLLGWLMRERLERESGRPPADRCDRTRLAEANLAKANPKGATITRVGGAPPPDLRLHRLAGEGKGSAPEPVLHDLSTGIDNGRRGGYRLWRRSAL